MKKKEIIRILEKWHRIYSEIAEEEIGQIMKEIYKAKKDAIETISQELLNPNK